MPSALVTAFLEPRAPAYTRREWARARAPDELLRWFRKAAQLPPGSIPRARMKSRRRNTPAIRCWDPASTKETLCAPTVRTSYFAEANSGRKFRQEISLEAFNPVIFYPARIALLAPWPVVSSWKLYAWKDERKFKGVQINEDEELKRSTNRLLEEVRELEGRGSGKGKWKWNRCSITLLDLLFG